jgi:cyclopropane fatty-acyl-phospholipid synthase-like methyltransferase
MKPANNPAINYKELVRGSYDECATAYANARSGIPNTEIEILVQNLPKGSRILDIGCGNGSPNCVALAAHFQVTGIDISKNQIDHAKRNVPSGVFYCHDVMEKNFDGSYFDAVVSFYAIFHLPKEEHGELFRRIYSWLKPSGYFIATLGSENEEAYTEDDFFGTTMYWSNFGKEQYTKMLLETGFKIFHYSSTGHGYTDPEGYKQEQHTTFVLQK